MREFTSIRVASGSLIAILLFLRFPPSFNSGARAPRNLRDRNQRRDITPPFCGTTEPSPDVPPLLPL